MNLSESKIVNILQNNQDNIMLCYCLWLSLPVCTQENLKTEFTPYVTYIKSAEKRWNKHCKKVFYHRPILDVLNDFNNNKKPRAACWELRARLPYLSIDEQYSIASAFIGSDTSNRKWILEYINDHWHKKFENLIKLSFETRHDSLTAEIICHHCDPRYIAKHAEELAKAYSYFEVRKHLPKEVPIDRKRMLDSEFVILAIRQGINIPDETIKNILLQYMQLLGEISLRLTNPNIKSFMDIRDIARMVAAIARGKRTNIIYWFVKVHEETKDFFLRRDIEGLENYLLTLSRKKCMN